MEDVSRNENASGTGPPMKRAKPQEPTFLDKLPQARIWVEAGISPGCAGKLVRAGYTSLAGLARASREDILSIHGVSTRTLEQLEELLGRPLRSFFSYWKEKGLHPKIAKSLNGAGIESLEALEKLTRKELRAMGIGSVGIQQCEELLGRPILLGEAVAAVNVPLEARTELEAVYRRLLELLAPLQTREGPSEERLRLALWNAARELEPLANEAPAGLDLTRNEPAIGEALYSYIVRQHFAPRLLDDPGNIHIPSYTPEKARLRVFREHGRWWVTWIKLERDVGAPEALSRELLVFETDEDGLPCVREV
jgi:predicted flap endonuclease-1-like 5' DNA nuclease